MSDGSNYLDPNRPDACGLASPTRGRSARARSSASDLYAPINDRPIIRWPSNARVAFWVAPNMEFFEYLPENRPTQPDIPLYARMDYGNRVGFWRMLAVLNKHKLRACCCLNLEILDHFPEIKDAMIMPIGTTWRMVSTTAGRSTI
jgi:hypothetical protein